jgi:hypothetical protein
MDSKHTDFAIVKGGDDTNVFELNILPLSNGTIIIDTALITNISVISHKCKYKAIQIIIDIFHSCTSVKSILEKIVNEVNIIPSFSISSINYINDTNAEEKYQIIQYLSAVRQYIKEINVSYYETFRDLFENEKIFHCLEELILIFRDVNYNDKHSRYDKMDYNSRIGMYIKYSRIKDYEFTPVQYEEFYDDLREKINSIKDTRNLKANLRNKLIFKCIMILIAFAFAITAIHTTDITTRIILAVIVSFVALLLLLFDYFEEFFKITLIRDASDKITEFPCCYHCICDNIMFCIGNKNTKRNTIEFDIKALERQKLRVKVE